MLECTGQNEDAGRRVDAGLEKIERWRLESDALIMRAVDTRCEWRGDRPTSPG